MMSGETTQIMTERDFVVFLVQIAGKLRDTDWEPSTDDLSVNLYGMVEHLDNTSSTDTRDGMTWGMIAAMILAGMKKTKAWGYRGHIVRACCPNPVPKITFNEFHEYNY